MLICSNAENDVRIERMAVKLLEDQNSKEQQT